MQALLKRAGSMLRPATPYIFQIQTMNSLRQETKVVVEGLASTVDHWILREAFSPYGDVIDAVVLVDLATRRSRGFGFVTYEDYASCSRAVGAMNQWELHGQPVCVRWASPPSGYSIDMDGSETRPFSLVGAKTTSVFDRWRNLGYKWQMLAPGMVLLKNYLTLMGQVDIVNICKKRAMGPGWFYHPRGPSGHELGLRMMCYGRQWDPVTRYEKPYISDGGKFDPPPIPDEFMSLVEIAIQDGNDQPAIISKMRPDICIANYYPDSCGRQALHQDCDESPESLERGLPVVSVSIGNSAEFWYGPTRDEIKQVRLDSGDVLIFGGFSRLYFHGVRRTLDGLVPRHLSLETGLLAGHINLTLKQY